MALLDKLRGLGRTAVFRTLAMAGALIGVIATTLAFALLWQTNAVVSTLTVQSLTSEAATFARFGARDGVERLADVVGEQSKDGGSGLYLLLGADNQRLAGNLNRWPPELPDGETSVFRYERSGESQTSHRLAIGLPVPVTGGRLLVARDLEPQRAYLATLRWLLVAAVTALTSAALLAGLLASRGTLRRIGDMTHTSERIMAGDLAERIPVSGAKDELDALARSLNAMLDRMGRLMAGLKEVSDNVAHDLKTPLTRLRNGAEAALRDARSGADYRTTIERVIEQADELIKTFDAMLLIARLEAGAVEPSVETFLISALMADVAEFYDPLAEQNNLTLTTRSGPNLAYVRANRQLLGQAIANLIDNAIKYAAPPPRGSPPEDILIWARAGADRSLELEVADRGPGIPAGDRARAFERFSRLDASRSRPGTGIGLSLVAAVARLHGGTVTLADNAPGLSVLLSLPNCLADNPLRRSGGTA